MVLNAEKVIKLARQSLRQEAESIETAARELGDGFLRLAEMLVGCEGLIFTTGVGTSAAVAERLAHLLNCCGARSMFLHPADGLHGHSGVLAAKDLLVAISRDGASREVNGLVRIARNRGVKTACLSADLDSELATLCDLALPVKSKPEYELIGCVATTSSLVESAVCDALCAVVQASTGYTPEQLGQTHPEGGVGRRLR